MLMHRKNEIELIASAKSIGTFALNEYTFNIVFKVPNNSLDINSKLLPVIAFCVKTEITVPSLKPPVVPS